MYQIIDGDETARRCLDLIARHGPRLMREGGGIGGLSREIAARAVDAGVVARVTRMRRLGLSFDEIAAETGHHRSTVARVCREAGLRGPRARRAITPEMAQRLRDYVGAGKQPNEIAQALGISRSAASKRVKELGLSKPQGGARVRKAAPPPSVGAVLGTIAGSVEGVRYVSS